MCPCKYSSFGGFSPEWTKASDKPGFSPDKLGFSKTELFNRKSIQKNLVFQKLAFSGEKPGLSEKNLVYLIVVIFACHRSS